jgi:hypothetical protein
LRYAQAVSLGHHQSAAALLDHFPHEGNSAMTQPSALAQDVAHHLQAWGYHVALGVGVGTVYIDVAIEHPHTPGRWLLGVLCDNGIRHGVPYLRDYAMLKPTLLAQRGWHVVAVWSIDWAKNKQHELDRLRQTLQTLHKPAKKARSVRRQFPLRPDVP